MKKQKPLNFNSQFNLTNLIILDCIGSQELNTARSIHESLLDLQYKNEDEVTSNYKRLKIEIIKISNRQDFFRLLSRIEHDIESKWTGIIHIECHGGDNIIELGDSKETVTHIELTNSFRTINQLSQCGLGLVFACCNGLPPYSIRDFHTPAPFYFCLSRNGEIAAGLLNKKLISFYRNLFESGNIISAANDISDFNLQLIEKTYLESLARVIDALTTKDNSTKLNEQMITSLVNKHGRIENIPHLATLRKVARILSSRQKRVDQILNDSKAFLCGRELACTDSEIKNWLDKNHDDIRGL